MKRTSPQEEARKYVDRVIRTHERHGFVVPVAEADYDNAVGSAERIAKKASLKKRAA
jgi:hypothetical protein